MPCCLVFFFAVINHLLGDYHDPSWEIHPIAPSLAEPGWEMESLPGLVNV
jgi:hypothetical protein